MITIKRINIASAFRVGALVSIVVALITGLLLVLFQSLFTTAMVRLFSINSGVNYQSGIDTFTAFSAVTACIFYIMYVVFAGIFGGIGTAVTALAYNLVAGWVGGLEVELDGLDKTKRGTVDDIFE
jgi:Na+-driven multidrug efflux pump